jgi:outer membrane lipoprotein
MLIGLSACTTGPERSAQGDRRVVPSAAAERTQELRGQRVEWGGILLDSRNLREDTELEVLAYPLSADGRPDTRGRPQGRFIAVAKGYLETVEYAPGRQVTLSGPLAGTRQVRRGEASYRYPVVEVTDLTLWQREYPGDSGPRIHFGISGGSRGTGVGVGIGF